jgi:hypothetical protein
MVESFRLGVVWARGTVPLEVKPSDHIRDVIKKISSTIKIYHNRISLYRDFRCQEQLPDSTILNCHTPPNSLIYMQVTGPLPPSDLPPSSQISAKDYLGPTETEPTPEMKRIQSQFGPNAVSLAFFEHRDSLLPHVDRQTESSCYAIRVGEEAMKRFQTMAVQSEFSTHRATFLFGRITVRTGKVTVHVAMEPPQRNFADHFEIEEWFLLRDAIEIGKEFSMKCCGIAVSHKADPKYPVPSYLVQLAAKYQNIYGEYFTTLIVTPSGDSDVAIEAFQMSDVTMRLDRENWFLPPMNPHQIEFREEVFVCGLRRKSMDVNLCLCAVRVRHTHSKFPNHIFPSPSQHPTVLDLKLHLKENECCPNWYVFFDFNFLVFLADREICPLAEVQGIVPVILMQQDLPDELMEKVHRAIQRGNLP